MYIGEVPMESNRGVFSHTPLSLNTLSSLVGWDRLPWSPPEEYFRTHYYSSTHNLKSRRSCTGILFGLFHDVGARLLTILRHQRVNFTLSNLTSITLLSAAYGFPSSNCLTNGRENTSVCTVRGWKKYTSSCSPEALCSLSNDLSVT